MLNFDDTRITFSGRSNQHLRRAYWLYRLLSQSWLLKVAPTLLTLALKLKIPIIPLIRSTVFKHFCGGESLTDSEATVVELGKNRICTILNYSAEGKSTEEDFDRTTEEILQSIEHASSHPLIPFAVFKPTGITRFELLEKANTGAPLSKGEEAEYKRVITRFHQLCERAHRLDVPLLIDAEESWIQDAIDTIAEEMMKAFNQKKAVIYTTVQLYRTDRLPFLRQSYLKARSEGYHLGMKLVRGAYMEQERERAARLHYPDPIHSSKDATDHTFNEALKFCLENLDQISLCCGSHNEQSNLYLTALMISNDVTNNDPRVFFSQLLGMSDHISYNLAAAGYNVAKYVPYGPVKDVLPYLLRRAEENRSISGQTNRELGLLRTESRRRRLTP